MDRPSIRTVTLENLERLGFFCYKSKPKSEGYRYKLHWLQERLVEGLTIKILYEGERSVGFIEYMPGEHTWRVVDAPDQMVIHCLWIVGKAKGKGYGSRLVQECIRDARDRGKAGVAMVSSTGNWLANDKVFVRNGFQMVDQAPPSFSLLVHPLRGAPSAAFPNDWEERAQAFGEGMTVVYVDQCPYTPNVVNHACRIFEERGITSRVLKWTSAEEVRRRAPSAYGVFNIVFNGELFSYHYIGTKELNRLNAMLT